MSWKGVVTNAGQALLDQWMLGGHVLNITGATAGSGYVADADMRAATALNHSEDTASIISAERVSGTTKFKLQVGPKTGSAYTAHEIGLWANLDDGADVLFSLHQDSGDGVNVPSASESPDFAFAIYLVHNINNTGNLNITIDPSAYTSTSTFVAESARQDARHLRYVDTQTADWSEYDSKDDEQKIESFKRMFEQMAMEVAPALMSEGEETYDECVIEFQTQYDHRFVGTCSVKVYQDSYSQSTRWFVRMEWALSSWIDSYATPSYFGRYSCIFTANLTGLDSSNIWYKRLAEKVEKTGTLTPVFTGVTVQGTPTVRQSGNVCIIQTWIEFTNPPSGETLMTDLDYPEGTYLGTYISYPSKTNGSVRMSNDRYISFYDPVPSGDTSAYISITYIAN